MPETVKKGSKSPAKPSKAAKQGKGATTPAKTPVTQESLSAELSDFAQNIAKKKNPPHRPVEYTEEIAEEVCWRLAHGESLVSICRDDHLPHCATIYRWLARFPLFCEMYARAREDQADTNADEILQIADEMPPEFTDEKGRTYLDQTFIQWQKNRIDARKWTAAKLKPRKYGDRMAVEGVEGGAAIKTEDAGANKFLEIIRNMEMSKRAG
jgi:hypothetical protein